MPRVAFSYPESAAAKWALVKKQAREEQARKPVADEKSKEYLGALDFRYKVYGNAPFKPTRVYNDGVKTIIEMPSTFSQGEAPTLLVVRDSGSIFTKNEEVIVNYRLQDGRYVVDTIFDKAVLIAGVGAGQRRVTIEKRR
jgi:type IV secretion system protein VirB9